jgi:sigma-B regulation protein RsbU (phosphoserine phosphatase)
MSDQRPVILVADDEPGVVRALTRILGSQHRILIANDGSTAEKMLRSEKVDLALIDVRMPAIDGFELLRRLKRDRPDTDVIMMTGSVSDTDQKLVQALEEGAFYFITKPFERSVLLALVERCLKLRRLDHQQLQRMAEMKAELEIARAFQRSLLPAAPLVAGGISVHAALQPTVELSGDVYDYGVTTQGRPWFFIGDVSGHGARAAMVTGIVKAALQGAVLTPRGPEAAGPALRGAARTLQAEMFLTHFLGWIDGQDTLRYVNAGHPPGFLLLPGGGVERLRSTEPLISPEFQGLDNAAQRIAFPRGARLVLYSDGISEARSPQDQLFGEPRLQALLSRAPADELAQRVLHGVTEFQAGRPQDDDWTLLIVDRG